MKKKYIVELTEEERRSLQQLISSGRAQARKLTRAHILFKSGSGSGRPNWPVSQISNAFEAGTATIKKVRKKFVQEGLETALNNRKPNRQYKHKLDGDGEAHLIALDCSKVPQGYQRWTLKLLADRMVQLGYIDNLSYETVWRTLKKTSLSLG